MSDELGDECVLYRMMRFEAPVQHEHHIYKNKTISGTTLRRRLAHAEAAIEFGEINLEPDDLAKTLFNLKSKKDSHSTRHSAHSAHWTTVAACSPANPITLSSRTFGGSNRSGLHTR